MVLKLLKRLGRDESGATAPLIMMMIPVFIGFLAFAADMGSLYFTKSQLQSVSDSAALAAASRFDDITEAGALALTYAEKNTPVADYGNIMDANDVVFGQWNLATRVFTAGATPLASIMLP